MPSSSKSHWLEGTISIETVKFRCKLHTSCRNLTDDHVLFNNPLAPDSGSFTRSALNLQAAKGENNKVDFLRISLFSVWSLSWYILIFRVRKHGLSDIPNTKAISSSKFASSRSSILSLWCPDTCIISIASLYKINTWFQRPKNHKGKYKGNQSCNTEMCPSMYIVDIKEAPELQTPVQYAVLNNRIYYTEWREKKKLKRLVLPGDFFFFLACVPEIWNRNTVE